jgi:hypothetical protein
VTVIESGARGDFTPKLRNALHPDFGDCSALAVSLSAQEISCGYLL